MKDYKEVAKSVFQRSEEIALENRKKKKAMLKAGSAAGCFCLAAVLGFGSWRGGEVRKTPAISAGQSADNKNSSTALGGLSQYPEDSGESVLGHAPFIGYPDDRSSFDPSRIGTMISSYPGGEASSYAAPGNGTVSCSTPLSGAMKEYGESVLYRVAVELFHDKERLDSNGAEVKSEIERLKNLGYLVAFETYNDGVDNHCYFTLHVKYGQLKNFAANNNYGYMLFLYGECVD